MIRDQVIHENKMSFLQTKCFSCLSKDHISINCPLIHFTPNKMKVVKRFMRDPGQKNRSNFKRIRGMKFNSLYYLNFVKKTCNKFEEICTDLLKDTDNEQQQCLMELEELTPASNIGNHKRHPLLDDESPLMRLPKMTSLKFSQYFIKDNNVQNNEKLQNSLDEEYENNDESIIMENNPAENFASAWNSQNILEIQDMEKLEKPTFEQNISTACQFNIDNDRFQKNSQNNYKYSMENYIEPPTQIHKSFTSESNVNNNGNSLKFSLKRPRFSMTNKDDFKSAEWKSAIFEANSILNFKFTSCPLLETV